MNEDQLLELMFARKSGVISSDDDRLLEETLRANPAARALWEQVQQHTLEVTPESTASAWQEIVARYNRTKRGSRIRILSIAGAGIAAVLVGVIFFLRTPSAGGPSIQNDPIVLTLADGTAYRLDTGHQRIAAPDATITSDSSGLIVQKGNGRGSSTQHQLRIKPGYHYTVILQDGTKVTLSGGSTFCFPGSFAPDARETRLTGSAYFEIAKNKRSPFTVDANGAGITVTGTAFDVDHASATNIISVTEGSVSVMANNKRAHLQPGQQAIISDTIPEITLSRFNIDSLLRLQENPEMLRFEDVKLKDVCRIIERVYGYRILIHGDRLSKATATGAILRSDPPTKFFDLYSRTGIPLRYEIKDSTIHLYMRRGKSSE